MPRSTRKIFNQDALAWLKTADTQNCSFVTSLPDWSELSSLSLGQWKVWFNDAASQVLAKIPEDGLAVFFQTDIKHEGTWINKAQLCLKAAANLEIPLLWHKIVCRVAPDHSTFGRPAYSHLLCFAPKLRLNLDQSTPDVLALAGNKTWARGMGTHACRVACAQIQTLAPTHTVIDPFCGHGTVLAVANYLGLNAIGVELGPKRARRAQELIYDGENLHFLGDQPNEPNE